MVIVGGQSEQHPSDTHEWMAAACSSKRDDRRASLTAQQPRIIIVFSRLTLSSSSSSFGSFGRHLIHNHAASVRGRPAAAYRGWTPVRRCRSSWATKSEGAASRSLAPLLAADSLPSLRVGHKSTVDSQRREGDRRSVSAR